jgi:hypothetical protein
MNFGIFIPIVAILATAWVVVTLVRHRYGSHGASAPASVAGAQDNARLAHENETYRLTIKRLEERMAVLERIATDPAERTAREIDELR